MTQVDELLQWLLDRMNPCATSDCLTLYEPASWSVVRWLTAVFLSIICILPLIIRSFYKFAQPGLTKNEKIMFRKWTIFSLISIYSLLGILFFYAIPMLYSIGDSVHTEVGLKSQYDAVHMFIFALSIFWTCLIGFILVFATISAGSTGLITDSTKDWWRIRIHGIGGLVLLLSLPGRWNGTNIALITTMIIILEYVITNSVRKTHSINSPKPMFDHEGRRRLLLYVEISDKHEDSKMQDSPENTAFLRCNSLTDNINERDIIVDTVVSYRITDTIIIGCDDSKLPTSFQSVIKSANCSMWFLQDSDNESIMMLQKRILGPNNSPNN